MGQGVLLESKMLGFGVTNFMSITKAYLEFDESGILNLCGYNDSGKSAITRALEVLFYDSYSGEQVNYVQDEKEYFQVYADFSDGVKISKYKYSNGKSVWEMERNGQMVYTNRVADGVASLGDIPEVIANYLGVVKDDHTEEKLNVRRNTDRLFLINTTGGDNYKIVNSVLHCDVLAESVNKLNEDRNQLQTELIYKNTRMETLQGELKNTFVLDEEAVTRVEENTKKLTHSRQRIDYLISIRNQKHILDEIVIQDEVPLVDTTRLKELKRIESLKKATEIAIYDECQLVDTSRYMLVQNIVELRESLKKQTPPEVKLLNLERFNGVGEVVRTYNNLIDVDQRLSNITDEHQKVLTELTFLSNQYGFKICKTCGTVVG